MLQVVIVDLFIAFLDLVVEVFYVRSNHTFMIKPAFAAFNFLSYLIMLLLSSETLISSSSVI